MSDAAVMTALDEKVLVLNRLYTAVRVVSARRAFVLLCKRVAEVIAVEDGVYANYDFQTWTELAALQREYARNAYSWIRTPRIELPVPKIIRLFDYDRVPRNPVKLNRRNIYTRDGNRCQYCGRVFPSKDLTLDHITPPACRAAATRGKTSSAPASRATPAREAARRSRPAWT